ncbi:F0F1 ATP synthase subunit delta [Synechococcus sp. Cruz-9H2]|jgi:F-type H+-transporting ATPase subunit delta|uniref:ATP synthase F1 subunit delta n=1 Tax=unclassified Synechococcus TaxID=2626047 RepID=UPI0020CF99C0|nr:MULTISPECIES: ATP synthase F1 subunit delta [unclassified Synechococcus]MCP9819099.1 F0F1 ATP synthase subunit delta [Synechococcus sp. Cruz-9H2]MCP9843603.1 F0F1 ATP synthase subunit delta [Synechococcus sp. Edmonson 11F2]MCP9855678.1 F0F1 ATP synthase subunit delta [Synechococcus sp. Cruz-9C9]MCP9863116.1 F0F1 ATP synthase subunit delta [Synechococcus sp. Cruz-7E5]MCP9870009.1 F0F1 ATP synthase subunit delta [Synechococcus sp. Cruz-7B9]
MPLLNSISTPYAEALLQVVDQRQETELVAEQAKELLELWHASPELRAAFASPVLEPDAKKKALITLFEKDITPTFLTLLKVLADRQRISMLDAVLDRFLVLYREQRGIALARVTSASPLSEQQQQALHTKVQAVAGTDKVEFDLHIDPALIGGFVVSVGSQVIDASLAGQVRRLGLALAKAG